MEDVGGYAIGHGSGWISLVAFPIPSSHPTELRTV